MIAIMMVMRVAVLPAEIELTVDPDTSHIDVEICVQGECDRDDSSISGFMVIDLDCLVDPTEIALQDFDVAADERLDFHLDYRFLGDIYITADDLALYHADPGGQPFFPLEGGEFVFTNVKYLKRGTVEYEAVGVICAILRGQGVPCEGRMNLDEQPPGTADEFGGSIEIDQGMIRLSSRLDFDEPFDPENPELGRIRGTVVMNAFAPLVTTADLDLDQDVDVGDFALMQLCFGGSGNPPDPDCPQGVNADLDCDEDVDLDDYAILAGALTGP